MLGSVSPGTSTPFNPARPQYASSTLKENASWKADGPISAAIAQLSGQRGVDKAMASAASAPYLVESNDNASIQAFYIIRACEQPRETKPLGNRELSM